MSLISFEQFKWLDVLESDVSSAVDYLTRGGFSHAAELLQAMPEERPFIDTMDDVIVATFQFPDWVSPSDGFRMSPASLRIVITLDTVVTVHPVGFPSLDEVRARLEQGRISKSISSSQFTGELLRRVVQTRFDFIDELSRTASKLEDRVFDKADKRDLIEDLMELKMVISGARRIAPPQQEVVREIAKEIRRKNWGDEDLMDDLADRIDHIITLLGGLKDRAEILTEANEAFLNHSLNDTLKLLTLFSVIMITPTLVAGIFGMNVEVPWQDHGFGFLFVTSIMGALALGGVLLFTSRRGA